MKVEFVGQSVRDGDNAQSDPSRLVNFYRYNLGGTPVLRSVLGTEAFAEIDAVFLRALHEYDGKVFAALGGNLYKVRKSGVSVLMDSITDSAQTSISVNNGIITIAAGGDYANFTVAGAKTTPATGAFSSVGSVAFLGQRTIITELNGRRISWSDVTDPATFDGFNFATAESSYDDIVRGVVIGSQYWVFKKESIERWYLTGSGDATQFLAPIAGASLGRGLKSFNLLTTLPNGAFFVGSDGKAYIVGEGMQPVSTRGVETSIKTDDPTHCLYYQDEGQEFCVIRFGNRPAWVYDLTTGEWHERAEAFDRPWSAIASVKAWGDHYVGTDTGLINRLARVNTDVSGPLIRSAVSRTLEFEGKGRVISNITFAPTVGQSRIMEASEILDAGGGEALDVDGGVLAMYITDPDAIEARALFEISSDRGQTWRREMWRGLGLRGEYDKVVNLRALGQHRNANIRMTISEPSDTAIVSTADVVVA